jgi:choline dehydrogenase-like flavoprotein
LAEYKIKGVLHDPKDNPIPEITITAYDKDPLSQERLGSVMSSSKGLFEISFSEKQFDLFRLEGAPEVFLVISDSKQGFLSVRDQEGDFAKAANIHGKTIWTSNVFRDISDLSNYDITAVGKPREIPECYEAIVIGSGFGGTIVSLTLANWFDEQDPTHKVKRVCVLERGQWWVSHEMPVTHSGTTDGTETIREYLEKNHLSYGLYPYPDNTKGFLKLLSNTKLANPIKGLYDYKSMKNVNVLAASGVGGGSLVYFNLTTRPEFSVYESWPTQTSGFPLQTTFSAKEVYGDQANNYVDKPEDLDKKLFDYFDIAQNFVGVNTITTNTGLGTFKLPRTDVFQVAAQEIYNDGGNIINQERKDSKGNVILDENGKPLLDFDAPLSITDVPAGLFEIKDGNTIHPMKSEVNKYSGSRETNVCQRQGRCGLGCIPGARHTLDKHIFNAMTTTTKNLDVYAMCEVTRLEETKDDRLYKYMVTFKDYNDTKDGIDRTIKAKYVILAAGTLGSTDILWKSKSTGLQISNAIGTNFSTNGDMFAAVLPTKEKVDASKGPMLTSIARFKDKDNKFSFSIEDLGIPKMVSEILPPILLQMIVGRSGGSFLPQSHFIDIFQRLILDRINDHGSISYLSKLTGRLESDSEFMDRTADIISGITKLTMDVKTRAQSPEERLYRIMLLFGMGIDESKGKLVPGPNGHLDLQENYNLNHKVFHDMVDSMRMFAARIGRNGEKDLTVLLWSEADKTQITAHPLGGCPMGHNFSDGVVDGFGQVFRDDSSSPYKDMYVVDGSIIPNALGVNPSLTISAIAFKIAEQITGAKKYWPK